MPGEDALNEAQTVFDREEFQRSRQAGLFIRSV